MSKYKVKFVFRDFLSSWPVLEAEFSTMGELEAFIFGLETATGYMDGYLLSSDSKIFLDRGEFGLVELTNIPFVKETDEEANKERLELMDNQPIL